MRIALLTGVLLLAACGGPETELGSEGGGIVFNGDEARAMHDAGFRAGFDDFVAGRTLGPELAYRRVTGREPQADPYDTFLEGYERGFSAARTRDPSGN